MRLRISLLKIFVQKCFGDYLNYAIVKIVDSRQRIGKLFFILASKSQLLDNISGFQTCLFYRLLRRLLKTKFKMFARIYRISLFAFSTAWPQDCG